MLQETLEQITGVVLLFVFLDVFIVMMMSLEIAMGFGGSVAHIGFWDAQLRFLFGWLS